MTNFNQKQKFNPNSGLREKTLSTAMAVMCAMLFSTVALGQTYQTISWDDYAANSNVPYCSCDFIKCAPPVGVTTIEWSPSGAPYTLIGDTLVLENGFNGQVDCYYDGGGKYLRLRPLATPTSPLFEDLNLCTLTTVLDAGNYNQYGFTTYNWSNGASSQIVSVGPGTYTVNISNLCGSVNDDVVITYNNPNRPDLYEDQEFCYGETGTLDPHVSGPVSTLWSTGATTNELIVDESGTYSVYVLDDNGCDGRDTINVTVSAPTPEQVCYVGFDIASLKNKINWSSNLPENTSSINIYKETSLDEWTFIGNVESNTYSFIDTESDPAAQSYSYKIASIDTCGNVSELSSFHTTITLLSTYDGGTDTYGFTWSAYQGISVSDYLLYGINAESETTLIGSVPGNQYMYNYVNPDEAYIRYFVAFETPDCSAKENVLVKSNLVISVLNDIEAHNLSGFSMYPNPATDKIEILTSETNFEVQVLNIFGQVVLKEVNCKTLDINGLAAGSYVVKVQTNGEVSTKKLIVN